jgi:hypothetical protein
MGSWWQDDQLYNNDVSQQLDRWLAAIFKHDVLMFCKNKHPAYKHAHGRWWGWEDYRRVQALTPCPDAVGTLLHGLCCTGCTLLDVNFWDTVRFPKLTSTPESVRKGMHILFRRSPLANCHGYYNRRSQVLPQMDFKTRCSNSTRGLVVTAPSTGKGRVARTWEVELMHNPRPADGCCGTQAPYSQHAADARRWQCTGRGRQCSLGQLPGAGVCL